MDARIVRELALEIARERGIELEKEELRIRRHPACDLAGMNAFARAVLRDNARPAEVDLARDLFHKRFGARHDGSDLKWALEEPLKEQGAHSKGGNSPLPLSCCPVAICSGAPPKFTGLNGAAGRGSLLEPRRKPE